MPTLSIKVKLGEAEVEIKADGTLDKETIQAIKNILTPITSRMPSVASTEGGPSVSGTLENQEHAVMKNVNLYSKFKELILDVFKLGQWFTSIDAKEAFHDTYGILLKASTVTTYLRRMEEEGLLLSRRQGRLIQFKVASTPLYATITEPRFDELKT